MIRARLKPVRARALAYTATIPLAGIEIHNAVQVVEKTPGEMAEVAYPSGHCCGDPQRFACDHLRVLSVAKAALYLSQLAPASSLRSSQSR
jgi:hypothetical protein